MPGNSRRGDLLLFDSLFNDTEASRRTQPITETPNIAYTHTVGNNFFHFLYIDETSTLSTLEQLNIVLCYMLVLTMNNTRMDEQIHFDAML